MTHWRPILWKCLGLIVIHRRYPQAVKSVDNPFRHAVATPKVIHTLDTRDTLHIATRSPKGMAQAARLVLVASLLLFLTVAPAYANGDSNKPTFKDYLKIYAHTRIVAESQYKCFNVLMERESHWNHRARNGSHYGIGQMRSLWYKRLSAYQQIDASIGYIIKRYGNHCNALAFHDKRGWY
jgi:hypothetical protein